MRTYHYTLQTHSIYNWRRIAISIVRKARNLKISLGRARISWSNFKKNLHIQKHHRNKNHEESNYNTTRWITVNKIIALGSIQKSNLFNIFRLIHKRDNFFEDTRLKYNNCWLNVEPLLLFIVYILIANGLEMCIHNILLASFFIPFFPTMIIKRTQVVE